MNSVCSTGSAGTSHEKSALGMWISEAYTFVCEFVSEFVYHYVRIRMLLMRGIDPTIRIRIRIRIRM